MPLEPLPPTEPAAGLEVRLTDGAAQPPLVRGRVGCPGLLTVGRQPTSRVLLPADDEQASRMHFHIDLDANHCLLTNHSKLGTFVNGLLVQTACDLRHADLIRAGRSVFVVHVLRGEIPVELAPAPTVLWEPGLQTTQPTAAAPPTTPGPPTALRVPGYRLLRLLGTGGMGNVWLAEGREGEQVACKLVRPELALNPDVCARFRRETNHLRDLSHRHIVGFREAGESQGLLYLVMEYVPGDSMAELLRQDGPFAVGRAVRLVCQVLDALGEAHNNGVVHRDVKPSNILIRRGAEGEEVRLADFGMAKVYQTADMTQPLTLPGATGGTLPFAAPEMVTDFRRAGPLADQYGAAATMYNLLTGHLPHDAENAVQMLDFIRSRDAVPLAGRRPGVPAELCGAIHQGLDREPRRRFPTVKDLRSALLPFAD